ncbi:Protoheme IX farnesyltransferase [Candidatus Promineifilum breve]|uniref:Protoheme IX farnesyltransferase n=1 Tax=Candidatus Promineifilum breve TaxID=1806508 RepID=A0A160T671_9CHLR|nr:COX15/CtaA family protein [Candidatus Promineifilum breve]CUS05019.2 Protoheme IX farnesyltransferase [Candidatus Promineifilum breve]
MRTFFGNRTNFTRYAWFVLGFMILVILWGAFVRATGSGAGCGSHWPLCNGVVVPRAPRIETLIEFTHRITSGFSGILVLVMLGWAFRLYPKGHIVRRAAAFSTLFVITEGLVGAGLVLFEWVADNESVARAISMAVHLVNTNLLLAAITLTAWWAGADAGAGEATGAKDQPPANYVLKWRGQGRTGWLLGGALGLLLLLGVSGAITALGDTLFPSGTLREGIAADFLPTAHFLVRLRVYHPILAVLTGVYLWFAGPAIAAARPGIGALTFSRAIRVLVVVQLLAGVVNILLNVPVWMQLIHLLLADLMWITVVLLAAVALSQPAASMQPVALAPLAVD